MKFENPIFFCLPGVSDPAVDVKRLILKGILKENRFFSFSQPSPVRTNKKENETKTNCWFPKALANCSPIAPSTPNLCFRPPAGGVILHNYGSENLPTSENRVRGSFGGHSGGRSGIVRGSFGAHSGFVQGRSGFVRGSFGSRSEVVLGSSVAPKKKLIVRPRKSFKQAASIK